MKNMMILIREKLLIKQKSKKKLEMLEIEYLKTRCSQDKTLKLVKIGEKPEIFIQGYKTFLS